METLDNIKLKSVPRKGWEKSFKLMHAQNDDTLLMTDVFDDEILEDSTKAVI